jgi:SagB-type dehydrogenase family enzyme
MEPSEQAESYPGREWMKSNLNRYPEGWRSDQNRGVPNPPLQKNPPDGALRVELPEPDQTVVVKHDIAEIFKTRRSRRRFYDRELSLEQLSFLLWATSGVQRTVGDYVTMRTVPSAGARHPYDTYVLVRRVEGLPPGVWRYLPLNHELVFCREIDDMETQLTGAVLSQAFVAAASAVFVWAAVPYRGEWRYGPGAHKPMVLDAGHICQNLYLATEALGLGACAIAAYDQVKMDELLDLDGQEEFVVYLSPVGSIEKP